MSEVLILGAGRFGSRAAEALNGRFDKLTVVDRDPVALKKWEDSGAALVCADVTEALLTKTQSEAYDYFVPAVPIHVVYTWLLAKLRQAGSDVRQISIPPGLPVPNPFYLEGTLYASLAQHICPTACPEPEGYCYITGDERPVPLYRQLANLQIPGFAIYVVQSVQLAPGVGGVVPADLMNLFTLVQKTRGKIVIATSCSCHSVLNAFTF